MILRSPKNVDLQLDLGISLGFWYFQTHHSPLPIQILHGLKGAFLATLLGSEVLQTLGIALMQLEDLLAAFWGYMEQDIFIVGNNQQCSGTPSKQDQLYRYI